MQHNFVLTSTSDRKVCTYCGLYNWYDVKTSPCSMRYVDPDTTRPPVNERVKRELGWDLQNEYEREE